MIAIRSLFFVSAFYAWSTLVGICMLPLLLAPGRWMLAAMDVWAQGIIALLPICGVRVQFRGLNHLPPGPALIAAKHQCMFDTMGPLVVLQRACYVMKKELTRIPFYGWFSAKSQAIVVDREGEANALRGLLVEARQRVAEGRQVVIFPEGTRTAPGVRGEYQPGVAGLYRTLGLPCVPMATNSGVHWPAHGFLRTPGTIVYEFLDPIQAGLRREEFMAELERRIETASARLLSE